MKNEKVVMYDSPEAASLQTVTGWVARGGQFWDNDEHMARYVGSTHKVCSVDSGHGVVERNYCCEKCRATKLQAKFDAMARADWDGTTPLVVFDSDTYFFDEDSVRDWLLDNDIALEDAQLVICKPNMACEFDGDCWSDDLPEDGELSTRLQAAIEELNKVARSEPPLSWTQGDVVAVLPKDFLKD